MSDAYAERLYEWERGHVEPLVAPEIMSRYEISDLVANASSWLNMRKPQVKFHPLQLPCVAYLREHRIEIGDWGRNRCTVLHELAHLAAWPRMAPGEDGHGPTFLTIAICLYARFLQIPLKELEASARLCRLEFRSQETLVGITQSTPRYNPQIADF